MINSFLVTLHNDPVQPQNPAATKGDVLWPDPYTPKVYTGSALLANSILFNDESDPLIHFLISIQLLRVVEESVCADTITRDDSRVSYTDDQLLDQFEGTSYDPRQVNRIFSNFSDIRALDFLTGELLGIYRTSLSRMDRLAAVIAYFGLRND
jgi:hypothetical protein